MAEDNDASAEERQEWIDDAVEVLIAEPFSWLEEHARSYADTITDTYLAEGMTPE